MIRGVDIEDPERVRGFLEAMSRPRCFCCRTSLFSGPNLGESRLSGNYHLAEENGRVVAVFF
jgi:hypothetical protein